MGIDLILVAVAVFVGGGAIAFTAHTYRSRKKLQSLPTAIAHVSKNLTVIPAMNEQVSMLARLSARIADDSKMALTVGELALTAGKIVKELTRDSRDLDVLRPFVDYHLPKSVELVEEYMVVAAQPPSEEREEALESARATLSECHVTFNAFFQKSLVNDVAGLEIKSNAVDRIGRLERPVV